MKKLFLSLVALIAATMSFAQSTLVATLSHGDEIRMYYGTNALRAAWAEAESGDVINLSGGRFNMGGDTFTKAVTIRGTGIDAEVPTVLSDFNIDIPETETNTMSMEGIRTEGGLSVRGAFEKALFMKCYLSSVTWYATSMNKAGYRICNCKGSFQLQNNSNVNFVNCSLFQLSNNDSSSALLMNCVLRVSPAQHRSSFVNCILWDYSPYVSPILPASCAAVNCLYVSNEYKQSTFQDLSTAAVNCSCTYPYNKVFKSFYGFDYATASFELTDEAKTTYLGTDEKEIGMYGGDLPYSSTPSYPQITKMNVANKTTADGKLSVEIEVSAAE